MNIIKMLTKFNLKVANRTKKDIKYIVIHYIGGVSGAKNNAEYWASKYIGSSAHYIVGHEGEIYQSVQDIDIAWHCGADKYKHKECRNANSIGIEMCVRKVNSKNLVASDKDWYFEDATVDATVELTKELMKKYDIPESNVIRHYDVTGKTCPAPYVHNTKLWDVFKDKLKVSKPNKDKSENTTNKPNDDIKSDVYTVQSGDSLGKIAKKFNTTVDALAKLNGIKDINKISVGQKLKIREYQTYTVIKGDTLMAISKKLLGQSDRYKEIMELNKMTGTTLMIGQVLVIPFK